MKIEMSDQSCKCGRKLKKSLLRKKNPVCYRCYCKAETLRGHMVNHAPRKKRLAANLPVKSFA